MRPLLVVLLFLVASCGSSGPRNIDLVRIGELELLAPELISDVTGRPAALVDTDSDQAVWDGQVMEISLGFEDSLGRGNAMIMLFAGGQASLMVFDHADRQAMTVFDLQPIVGAAGYEVAGIPVQREYGVTAVLRNDGG